MELTALKLIEARRLLEKKEISAVELTTAHLKRIEKFDPRLNCFITLTPEDALKQAQAADQFERNPINQRLVNGIPIALKDLYETRGVPTTAGSTFFRDFVPEEDAFTVQKLANEGAVILGKLNMHEIALGVTNVNPHYGACHNPWDETRITGGSSGGSAAALAADLCLGSLGSDSGGSIRIPASLCGVVGLKPTYGRISLRGVIPLSWNTDHAGPMGKSVEDVTLLLQAIAGYDSSDPYSINQPVDSYFAHLKGGIRGWRIALAQGEYFSRTDPEVWQAVEEAARILEELGAIIDLVDFPDLYTASQANLVMVTSDASTYHSSRILENPDGFGEDVLRRLELGAAHTMLEYTQARHTQTILRRQYERFFENYDILIMPTTPVTAPPIEGPDAVDQARVLTRYTAPFNITGLPAISLPCGFSSPGYPIGLQLITRPWAESHLLRAAWAYEQATEWHKRKPIIGTR